MIFVTVGTHEQQFNRLIECMDKWAKEHDEEVVLQTGYSNYEPHNCKWKRLFSYTEMAQNIADARIVITHGGPSSFIAPLQIGKIPIVVPRRKDYDEHVNNHQVNFCRQVAERMGTIILVDNINEISDVIEKYDEIIAGMTKENRSNNARFCMELEKIVSQIMK